MIKKGSFILVFLSAFLMACTGKIVNYSGSMPINLGARIAVVPFANYTETPLAGERAMAITASVMESRGLRNLAVYHGSHQGKVLFPGMNQVHSQKSLQRWARQHGAQYVLTGSVTEWMYKVGLDGEPVVGLSMQLVDLNSGAIVWTSVGSLSQGSRIAVSTTAQELINSLLAGLVNARVRVVKK